MASANSRVSKGEFGQLCPLAGAHPKRISRSLQQLPEASNLNIGQSIPGLKLNGSKHRIAAINLGSMHSRERATMQAARIV